MDYIQCTNCANCHDLDDQFLDVYNAQIKKYVMTVCVMLLAWEVFATSDWTSEDMNNRQLVTTFHQYRFLNPPA